ncbi:protein transport protein Sec23p [[Candida] jaroonii]|uniref:Protein transport protein Sec23p n=1 Tax=[Candida] jaroonii TaxID=467808 RepID=A0ACA9YEQ7_9ASCO|nr:protein transport protein Sec23p [[Candida] jaroonii]
MSDTLFEAREDIDGVRCTWNTLPRSKLQHERNIIPMATMYTPLNNKNEEEIPRSDQMILCRQCQSFINPYVVKTHDIWMCSYCGFSNRLELDPSGNLPIGAQYSTVEYSTGKFSNLPPIFLYVIDTCFEVEDLEDAYASLKESLVVSLSLLPENALVGVISYGKNVQIHNLTSTSSINHTFNGAKEYNLDQFKKALGLLDGTVRNQGKSGDITDIFGKLGKQFLQPVSIVEYEVTNIFETLVTNTFPRLNRKERPYRATGCAINIASLFLTSLLGNFGATGGHILTFVGGACTYGPGKIVGNQLREPLRSHHDIETSRQSTFAKNMKLPQSTNFTVDYSLVLKAKTFYKSITQYLLKLGISCSYFIGSYDQVGLYEMDEVCRKSGGIIIMSDSFNTSIFKQSFMKFFQKNPQTGYLDFALNATLEVKVQSDLKVQGLIGNAIGLPVNQKNTNLVSQKPPKGEGKTNSWKLCHINPQSTFAIYFEKMDSSISTTTTLIQYITHYQHASGEFILRVSTVPINIVPDNEIARLEMEFDQEAAVVSIARDAIYRLENENINHVEIVKEIDKNTIDFCKRFAQYTKGVVSSFMLSSKFAFLPHFVFHLRRSPFINVFNNSPDESSFIRHVLMHEDSNNSLVMIQPTLLSYDIDKFGAQDEEGNTNNEPEPVLLDSVSLTKNGILLLDTFFQILIYHGEQVASWRKAGYHEMEGYEHFKEFLEAPKKEALSILMDRFPLPRFIDCDEGGSQARFLMAKLNPSSSYSTNPNIFYGNQLDVLTDDLSMQSFMDHIQRVVTAK